MKQSKFSEEQIISILREAERGEQTITAICRAHSISENTYRTPSEFYEVYKQRALTLITMRI